MGLCGIMMSTQSGSAKTTPYKARRETLTPKAEKSKLQRWRANIEEISTRELVQKKKVQRK